MDFIFIYIKYYSPSSFKQTNTAHIPQQIIVLESARYLGIYLAVP